ncbi:hypothetical protein FGG08_000876 [Glutinoglossum americanum]|uniref:Uncharacterized protein n=1 Tax=Glutinoglossum americanum TaxID=1670608 RepID=A0A9P8L5P2_9PEZI|nr:hypothetical protein FGG08_000876 [Glutinoglossum americanum]
MPPRLPLRQRCLRLHYLQQQTSFTPSHLRSYAVATASARLNYASTSSHSQRSAPAPPIINYPSTQPPSYKPPEFRKSQLLRQYASLLRSTPLILLFQHNNFKSTEWVGVRRELTLALRKVDASRAEEGFADPAGGLADGIKLQTIQTGIFEAALKITEYFDPIKDTYEPSSPGEPKLTHTLSRAAHEAAANRKLTHALAPLLSGPLVLLTFPAVSPQHLRAALSILSPSQPSFPAPTRRANPGYHDPAVQNGVSKLLLLGARVEGRVFDAEGTRWVGGIEGGIDGLRAQLVGMLQGVGAGLTGVLEGAGRSLYFTLEGRREMLEEDTKKGEGEGEGKTEGG